jgi:DNA-directed RNA polymerase subunit RPC12/RpoP
MNVECSTCGAVLEAPATARTFACPYCASPSVVERPPTVDAPRPTFTLTFELDQKAACEAVRRWARNQGIFAHGDLVRAPLEEVRGVYVPAYLYGALLLASYDAEIGENYTTTETYTTTDSKGNSVTRTRTRTHTEYRHLSGEYASYVTDVLVTASRAIHNTVLERIEPFDFRTLKRYTPALVSGWTSEEPTLTRKECLELARGEASSLTGAQLAAFMPGDSHRNLTFNARVEQESADLLFVPLWVVALRLDPKKPPTRVVVNGQTGSVYGQAPISVIKVLIAIGIVLAVIAVVYLLGRR